jgi:hypothetical protein
MMYATFIAAELYRDSLAQIKESVGIVLWLELQHGVWYAAPDR